MFITRSPHRAHTWCSAINSRTSSFVCWAVLKNDRLRLLWRLASTSTLYRFNEFMSQHRSLKGTSTIAAKRNVLKRFERVELLKKRGQWKDDQKVTGLPKTKPDV